MYFQRYNPWKWAYKARNKFLKQIGYEEELLNIDENDISAAVFGYAQEGKTTLVLKLLGATDEEIELLEQALRGGASYGQSATKAAIIYHPKDINENYTIREQEIKILKEKIKEIYESKEFKTHRVVLPIPKRTNIKQVIDLIGLNPASIEENKQALELARKIISIAPIRFYVTRADHMSNLDPQNSDLQEITNLIFLRKDTSFIVLTGAFEVVDDEILNYLKNFDLNTTYKKAKLYFKCKVYLQLKGHNINIKNEEICSNLNCEKLLLENSIEGYESCFQNNEVIPLSLKGNIDTVWKRISELALEDIREIILKNNPYELQVKSLFDMPSYIKKTLEQLDKNLHKYNQKRDKLNEKLKKQREKIKKIEEHYTSKIQSKAEIINNLNKLIHDWDNVIAPRIRRLSLEWIRKLSLEYRSPELNKKLDILKTMVLKYFKEMEKEIEKIVTANVNIRANIRAYYIEKCINPYKYHTLSLINNKNPKIIKYFIFKWINWDLTRMKLNEYLKEINNTILNCTREELTRFVIKVTRELMDEINTLTQKKEEIISYHINEIKKTNQILKNINHKFQELYSKTRKIKNILNQFEMNKFEETVHEEFISHWNSIIDECNKEQNPISLLECLSYLESIRRVLDDIAELSTKTLKFKKQEDEKWSNIKEKTI